MFNNEEVFIFLIYEARGNSYIKDSVKIGKDQYCLTSGINISKFHVKEFKTEREIIESEKRIGKKHKYILKTNSEEPRTHFAHSEFGAMLKATSGLKYLVIE